MTKESSITRAASELPDPLENPTAPAAGGGTDDLLSQLAGDEIDRLLAEADVESAEAPPVDQGAAAAAPAEGVEAAAAPVEEPVAAAAAATVAEEPGAAAAAEVAEQPQLESQLNELFDALKDPPPPMADAPAAEAERVAPKKAAPAAASDLDAQLEKLAQELLPTAEKDAAMTGVDAAHAEETTAAAPAAVAAEERTALLADAPAAGGSEADVREGEAGPLPWYLRPLLWMNAPFASLSDQARDLIGKVALATLLFSITILAFVVMTRHRL